MPRATWSPAEAVLKHGRGHPRRGQTRSYCSWRCPLWDLSKDLARGSRELVQQKWRLLPPVTPEGGRRWGTDLQPDCTFTKCP